MLKLSLKNISKKFKFWNGFIVYYSVHITVFLHTIMENFNKEKKVQILERFQGLKLFILWPLWDNDVQLIIQRYTELRIHI